MDEIQLIIQDHFLLAESNSVILETLLVTKMYQ